VRTPGLIDVYEGEDPLAELFDASPDRDVHTSLAAQAAFLAGGVALLVSPFALAFGLAVVAGALGLVLGVVGLARASRPGVAGGVLASTGLCTALGALVLVGLRYAGVDTAFGEVLVPLVRDSLGALNNLLPSY